jgi:hypothetical protein
MNRDTEPYLWPTGKLSTEEADRFFSRFGQVTIAMDERGTLLGLVDHCKTAEALQLALAQMRSDFPHVHIMEGRMRGHYFCEDVPDAGWRQTWELHPVPEHGTQEPGRRHWPEACEELTPGQTHDRRSPDLGMDR